MYPKWENGSPSPQSDSQFEDTDHLSYRIFRKRFTCSIILNMSILFGFRYGISIFGFGILNTMFDPLYLMKFFHHSFLILVLGLFSILHNSWILAGMAPYKIYTTKPSAKKRIQSHPLFKTIICGLPGGALALSFVIVANFQLTGDSLTQELCPAEKRCVNETSWFISLCGIFVAAFFWSRTFQKDPSYLLQFSNPILTFMEALFVNMYECFLDSFLQIIPPIFIYYGFYYIFGGLIRYTLSFMLNHYIFQDPLPWSWIFSMDTFIRTYTISYLVMSLTGICVRTTNLCFTQRLKFPIELQQHDSTNQIRMGDALSSTSKYIRQLSYQDLNILTAQNENRIQTFLKLSHPGRNPHAWQSILTPISTLIEDASSKIRAFADKTVNSQQESLPKVPVVTSKLQHQRSKKSLGLTNSVTPPQGKVELGHDSNGTKNTSPAELLAQIPCRILRRFFRTTIIKVKEVHGILHNICKTNKLAIDLNTLLGDADLLFSATEILVSVADFSFRNDTDGIISTTMGKIFAVHFQLYQALELLLESLESNVHAKEECWKELKLIQKLQGRYKTSLKFFYYNYSKNSELLQLPIAVVKDWELICSAEPFYEPELIQIISFSEDEE